MVKKNYILIVFLVFKVFFLNSQNIEFKIDTSYSYKFYYFHPPQLKIKDFYVNDLDQVFIPLNGGVFMPKDSIWFLKPKIGKYALSFYPNASDSAFFLLKRDSINCQLMYYKVNKDQNVNVSELSAFKPGLFDIIYNNNRIYIWGFIDGLYKIGQITKDSGVVWFIAIKEKITSVDIKENGMLLFSVDKCIFNLSSTKPVINIDNTITGFCIANDGEFIISTPVGLYKKTNNNYKFIASGVDGIPKYYKNKIYIILDKYSALLEIYPKYK